MTNKVDFSIEYAHIYGSELVSGNFVNEEHKQSIQETKRIVEELESRGKTYSLCVLIDDYNEPAEVDEQSINDQLKKSGLAPDYVVKESQMARGAEVLLNALPPKFKSVSEQEVGFVAETEDLYLWTSTNSSDTRSFKEILLQSVTGKQKQTSTDVEKTVIKREGIKSKFEIALKYKDHKEVKYSCPLMAASWHLSRLGVESFVGGLELVNSFSSPKRPFIGDRLLTILPAKYLKVEGTALEIISLVKTKTISKMRKRMEYVFF